MKLTVVRVVAALTLSLLAAPLVAGAQQAGKVYRVGYLTAGRPVGLGPFVQCSSKRSVSAAG